MTRVKINPGICGLITTVEAHSEDMMEVTVKVGSGCPAVGKLFEKLGNTFSAFDLILKKPGCGLFYDALREEDCEFPLHAGCTVLAGIIKCIEAECQMALPQDATITFPETKDEDDQTRVF